MWGKTKGLWLSLLFCFGSTSSALGETETLDDVVSEAIEICLSLVQTSRNLNSQFDQWETYDKVQHTSHLPKKKVTFRLRHKKLPLVTALIDIHAEEDVVTFNSCDFSYSLAFHRFLYSKEKVQKDFLPDELFKSTSKLIEEEVEFLISSDFKELFIENNEFYDWMAEKCIDGDLLMVLAAYLVNGTAKNSVNLTVNRLNSHQECKFS